MEFRLKRPRATQHKHTARCFSRNPFGIFGWNSQSKILTSGRNLYYTYLLNSTKSFQFVKSRNEITPARSSQENALGEAAHNERTTFTCIAVKSIHPGRLTWNIQITHLERKMIFQPCMVMFHVNLPGCTFCPSFSLCLFSQNRETIVFVFLPKSSRLKATDRRSRIFSTKRNSDWPMSQDENSLNF